MTPVTHAAPSLDGRIFPLCTALGGLQQVEATAVRVRCLMEKQFEQPGVFATYDDDGEHLVGVLAQQNGPASRREDESSANCAAQSAKECSARGQREQRDVDHGLDDVALSARDLVESVVRLQLLEEQLHLPAGSIRAGDVSRLEWLDRTLPLSARFPKGAINREDRLPVPAEALREIVINAVIHRDVSTPSSYVAIAVFDDRIEVRSIGDFPSGVRAEQLAREHLSVRRNPLIAEAFHRTGAIEAWGRGTNRVIEACRAYGIPDPEFVGEAAAVTVTFRAEVVAGAPSRDQAGTKLGLSRDQAQVLEVAAEARTLPELMAPFGRTNRTKFRDQVLAPLLEAGLVEMTIPDKPRSPKQQYRTTEAGRAALLIERRK